MYKRVLTTKVPITTMEGCSGSPNPPPPPPPLALKKKASRSGTKDVINMERNRREKMAEYYAVLQTIVPNLFPRATRTRVVDETIAYVKGLEEVLEALHAKKKAREEAPLSDPISLLTESTSSSVYVTVAGTTSFFGICLQSRLGLVTEVLQVFERNKADVLALTVACHGRGATLTVTASSVEEEAVERIKAELMII